jgi:hypothetical protein
VRARLEERPTQISVRWLTRDLPDLRDLARDLPVFLAPDLLLDLLADLVAELEGVPKPAGGSPFTESEPLAARIGAVIGVVVVVVVTVIT